MQPLITEEIFTRFANGEATAAEAQTVRAWLAEPANQALARQRMRRHWDAQAAHPPATGPADEPDYEALLAGLHTRLHFAPPYRAPPAPLARAWWPWAAAAAVAAGAVAGGGWLLQPRPAAAPAPLDCATGYGQARTLQLPDGSQVTLNGHSRLRYAATWAPGRPREVWLDGEGYFAVRHQPNNQRFVVHTRAGFSVEVLGTKFTVNRRRGQARVVLLSGRVRVDFDNPGRADVILRPGELLETRDAQPALLVHKAVHTAPYTAWKDARLVLDETTLGELADRLRDTYGLQVEVRPAALNQRKLTGTVPVRDLDVLLLALEEALHLKATRQGNRLVLSDPSTASSHPLTPPSL